MGIRGREERDGKQVYAGKIEGGWTEEEKNDLLARIRPYQQRNPPIEPATAKAKAQWVEPRVPIDVEYRARAGKSGLLRHPRYKGIREDLSDQRYGRGYPRRSRGAPSVRLRL